MGKIAARLHMEKRGVNVVRVGKSLVGKAEEGANFLKSLGSNLRKTFSNLPKPNVAATSTYKPPAPSALGVQRPLRSAAPAQPFHTPPATPSTAGVVDPLASTHPSGFLVKRPATNAGTVVGKPVALERGAKGGTAALSGGSGGSVPQTMAQRELPITRMQGFTPPVGGSADDAALKMRQDAFRWAQKSYEGLTPATPNLPTRAYQRETNPMRMSFGGTPNDLRVAQASSGALTPSMQSDIRKLIATGRVSPEMAETIARQSAGMQMAKLQSHKLNAILLDIIERSKPSPLVKFSSLRATINDDGMLKVASRDSYWLSARGACHLDFLAGVYDVDEGLAWTFAKNAGLEKEAGIIRGLGSLLGMGVRGGGSALRATAQTLGRGAGTVVRAGRAAAGTLQRGAGAVSQWYKAPLQSSLATSRFPMPSNPFARAAEAVKSWGTGLSPGAQGPAISPLRRAGRSMGHEFSKGYEEAMMRPTKGPLSEKARGFAGPEMQGQPPYRQGPVPQEAPPTTGPATAAGTGEPARVPPGFQSTPNEVPGQPPAPPPSEGAGKVKDRKKRSGNFLNTLGMLGGGALIGGGMLGSTALSTAGEFLNRGPAPYQYGMGSPMPWMQPQQM